ncbi:MAG: hypothetical protein ACI4HM_01240 [Ruminococcus sp.]
MKAKRIISLLLLITICAISIYGVSAQDSTPTKYGVSLTTPKRVTLGLGESYWAESKCYHKDCYSKFYDVVPEGDNSSILRTKKQNRSNYNVSSCLIKSNSVGEGDYYWTYSSKYYNKPKYQYGEPCSPKYATEFCVDVKKAPKKVYLNKTKITLKKGQSFVLSE